MRPTLAFLAGVVLVLALCRVDDAGANPGHDKMTATAAAAATMTADARTATAATATASTTASPTATLAPTATPGAAVTGTPATSPTPTGTPRHPTRTPRAGGVRVWLPWVG